MGITIHFEGKLKSEDAFRALIHSAKALSIEFMWPYTEISEKEAKLTRFQRNDEAEDDGDDEELEYLGPTRGIEIRPVQSCEPFRLEFDKDLVVQEYTKTQFAPIEVHVLLANFLKDNAGHFEFLRVFDEGEYFETGDSLLLQKHRDACQKMLDEHLRKNANGRGPVRLPSGRIADIVEQPMQT